LPGVRRTPAHTIPVSTVPAAFALPLLLRVGKKRYESIDTEVSEPGARDGRQDTVGARTRSDIRCPHRRPLATMYPEKCGICQVTVLPPSLSCVDSNSSTMPQPVLRLNFVVSEK
jgi:hypothetical protein